MCVSFCLIKENLIVWENIIIIAIIKVFIIITIIRCSTIKDVIILMVRDWMIAFFTLFSSFRYSIYYMSIAT